MVGLHEELPLLNWGFSSSKQQVIPFKKTVWFVRQCKSFSRRWHFCAWVSGAGKVAQSWQMTFLLRTNRYNIETSVRGLRFWQRQSDGWGEGVLSSRMWHSFNDVSKKRVAFVDLWSCRRHPSKLREPLTKRCRVTSRKITSRMLEKLLYIDIFIFSPCILIHWILHTN